MARDAIEKAYLGVHVYCGTTKTKRKKTPLEGLVWPYAAFPQKAWDGGGKRKRKKLDGDKVKLAPTRSSPPLDATPTLCAPLV